MGLNAACLRYDVTGAVRCTGAAPTAFVGGVGFNLGLLCIVSATPNHWSGGVPMFDDWVALNSGVVATYNNGLPLAANGAIAQVSGAGIVGYSGGLPVTSSGGRALIAAAEIIFLAQMELPHLLIAGQNPAGNRVGYRRGEWGSFLPDDVPLLSRLFTNPNNNRLVVQGDGDLTSLPISGIHIKRLSNGVQVNFGAPNNVIFDGVNTDFTWIVPFDFVLGESYTVSLT